MTETLVDLHAHVTDFWDLVINPSIPIVGDSLGWKHLRGIYFEKDRVFENEQDIVKRLLGHSLFNSPNSLVGLINFSDERAQRIFKRLKKICSVKGDYDLSQDGSLLTIVNKSNNRIANYIMGQEIATDKGHVVIVGNSQNIPYSLFRDVVKSAKEEHNALVFADHATREYAGLVKAVAKGFGKDIRLGLREEDIANFREDIDGMSVLDSASSRAESRRQIELARKYGVPVYACSDSHSIDGIFSPSVKMNLDLTNENNLKLALREELKKGITLPNADRTYANRAEAIRHMFSASLALAAQSVPRFSLLVRDYSISHV